jgi:hypothetical protein
MLSFKILARLFILILNNVTERMLPKLYNSHIKIVSETKFLGLLFDSKLTFLPHIKMLKNKSLKALNS